MARSISRSRSGGSRSSRSSRDDWSVGVMDMARERPVAAATIAVGAAAAGLFLWSKRAQISNQLNNLSDQVGKWTERVGNDIGDDAAGLAIAGSTNRRSNGSAKEATNGRRESVTGDYANDIGSTDKSSPNSRSRTSPSTAT